MSFVQPHYAPPGPSQYMQHMEPQSQVVCQNCRTLLMYPQGAQNVRCARCRHITARPTEGGDTAQLVCNAPQCRTVLIFARGASAVQCGACGCVNDAGQANLLGHLVCSACHITLMYAHGAQSVKCAVCHHVTHVTPAAMFRHSPPPRSQAAQPPDRPPPKQTVVIENPSSFDEHGNEIQNIVVGVASTGTPIDTPKR